MHPPPPPEILAKLAGHEVELASIGRYVLHLNFANGDRLSLACPFRFDSNDRLEESPIQEFPLTTSNVPRLVGAVVRSVDAEADGTLHVAFSSGDRLIAYANDPGYEAYTLFVGGREHVV